MLKQVLSTQVTNKEILDFIRYCADEYDYSDIEKNLLILEIYIVLKRTGNFIPVIDISLDAIPEKIILKGNKTAEDTFVAQDTCLESRCEKKQNDTFIGTPKTEGPYSVNTPEELERFRQATIDFYSPFSADKYPDVYRPEVGGITNLHIEDRSLVPGKHFTSEVLIDHEGNVTKFIKGPIEIIESDNYEEIYQGLIGQLFNYQKDSKN
jgi:hypothetical protein